MKRKLILAFSTLIVVFSLVGCQNATPSNSKKIAEESKEYYGTYVKVKEGELEGDYFDDYESVPLEDDYSESTVTLKSNGVYESEFFYYSESDGGLYSKVTNKYEYRFKDNEVIRERKLTTDNFKSFDKIYKYENGQLRISESYLEKITNANATIIKEEDDYVIYDRTEYKIANSYSDSEENHREYDFITIEGDMISVNYYEDDDRTAVSVYKKME